LYAWSSFVPALRETYALTTAQTQLIFGGLIAVFTLSMIPAGRLLNRIGPKKIAGSGAVLFGIGYLIASYSGGAFSILLLGISVIAGIGTGLCYVCPLALCGQWFPEQKGLVTGIAVAGFGGGALFLSYTGKHLFLLGWDVLEIFRWTGVMYGLLIFAAAMVLKLPCPAKAISAMPRRFTLPRLVQERFYWGMVTGMFSGTFAGLLVIGNLQPIALSRGISPAAASLRISAFALGNAAGRIAWGRFADVFGIRIVGRTLAFLAFSLTLLLLTCGSAMGFICASALIGFGFGACFVIYATLIGSRYGLDQVSRVYPTVFLAYGISGIVGPYVGGWLFDITSSYAPAIAAGIGIVAAGRLISHRLMQSHSTQLHRCEVQYERTAGFDRHGQQVRSERYGRVG